MDKENNIHNYKLSEIFTLWWIRIKNKIYLAFIKIIDLFILIKNNKLKAVDKEIQYFQKNEFSYEKLNIERDKINIDKEELTYGETPYFTGYDILKEVKAKKGMVVYDLGSGLGRFAYLANLMFGAKVVGIELIPSFIEFTNKVVRKFNLQDIKFIKANLFESNLYDADIIYIAGTCFSEQSKKMLENMMRNAKKGAKIITLSYSLPSQNLRLKKVKKLWFSWGWGTVFFQERI